MGVYWSRILACLGSSNFLKDKPQALDEYESAPECQIDQDQLPVSDGSDQYTCIDGSSGSLESSYSDMRERKMEIFGSLREEPEFKDFFSFRFPDMTVGKKIGTGGEAAAIYEGTFTLGTQKRFPCVLKPFSGDFDLKYLRSCWPEGMLKGGNSVFPGYFSGTSSILGGLVLEDGRFAMVLRREWGDLRRLIKLRMKANDLSVGTIMTDAVQSFRREEYKGVPPFSKQGAKKIMLEIAVGLRQLHNHGILHRDVKAANVLVSGPHPGEFPVDDDAFHVKVFDFESSVGSIGTLFFMAPEILQARMDGSVRDFIFTTKQDVYSYAMTCYEILTGCLPFHHRHNSRFPKEAVIYGERPEVPHGMEKWLRELIEQCWHNDPSKRPEFDDIVKVFKRNFSDLGAQRSLQEQINASEPHWTQLSDNFVDSDRVETNETIFARLKMEPQYAKFFSYEFHNLEVGRKIAEGGQGEVFEAEFEKANGLKVPCVLKVFKAGFSLSDMKKQWPPGMLESSGDPSDRRGGFGFMGLYPNATRTCEGLGGVVLEGDRFAFILNREGGDLRRLINLGMKKVPESRRGPFAMKFATKIIYEIAQGMLHLEKENILHRDLKAANVLVTDLYGEFPSEVNEYNGLMNIQVADFECSMLAVGTGFWRAPEILKQLPVGFSRQVVFTKEADVYSYGMTCYEVLTGGVPLKDRGFKVSNTKAVYEGERPILPNDIDDWLRKLIRRCWDSEPSKRPDFGEIIGELERKCSHLRVGR